MRAAQIETRKRRAHPTERTRCSPRRPLRTEVLSLSGVGRARGEEEEQQQQQEPGRALAFAVYRAADAERASAIEQLLEQLQNPTCRLLRAPARDGRSPPLPLAQRRSTLHATAAW